MSEGRTVYALGFYPWKRKLLRIFRPGEEIKFLSSPRHLPQGEPLEIATWGVLFADATFPAGSRITRYEDGFIRSVGLGAKFVPALSWVADRRGIYYDATKPSDLEHLLEHEIFPDHHLDRARALREEIIHGGLSKYNLEGPPWQRPPGARRVLLVPGQVETDAAIRLGTRSVKTNIELLQNVQRENPDAYLVYKPHPDVVAGVRRLGPSEKNANAYANEVVTTGSIDQIIREVDEVHVLTSLTGFEAMLRGKPVTTYGLPFYAGWGLTNDRHHEPRRTRSLSLDQLVAGSLISYSLYCRASRPQACEAEDLVRELLCGIKPPRSGVLEKILKRLSDLALWRRLIST